jgi:hypothetical protein
VSELPVQVLRTGTTQPPERIWSLRAGPVRALFSGGDLRHVCHGYTEIARRVYVAIRDLDWNTLPGAISDLAVTDSGDHFSIRFTRRHAEGGVDYRWHAEIDGAADGTISYRMRGTALTAFAYAKIGICVHHPVAGYAGQPFHGRTPEDEVSGLLPDAIGPQIHLADGTDLPLFEPVSELEIAHASGGIVRFSFTGDLWEMEDQRNWTDASYKSASTPARLGYHHEAEPGLSFDQQVVIRAAGYPAAGRAGGSPSGRVVLQLSGASDDDAGPEFPPVGLRCASPEAAVPASALVALRAISPAHLRADVRLAGESAGAQIAAAAARARELDCGLELAVFLPGSGAVGDAAALECLGRALAAARPPLARLLAFSETEESSSARTITAVQQVLAGLDLTSVPVIAGTNIYFNELNRHRLPPGGAAGLAWSVNPQIHAFDDLSLMENLQAQPDTVGTARAFAPGTPVFVTPVTLRPRFNAVAVTEQEFPSGGLPWQVDVRQSSLFAAAWTLGSIAALAGAGVAGLTYFDTVGPAGVVESADGSPSPAEFFSRPGTPYPLAVVLADACALAGGRIRPLRGADPARLAAVAVCPPRPRDGGPSRPGTVVLLANLTAQPLEVTVTAGPDGPAGPVLARLRVLDEHNAAGALADLPGFLASGTVAAVPAEGVNVNLQPYAVARLEVSGD